MKYYIVKGQAYKTKLTKREFAFQLGVSVDEVITVCKEMVKLFIEEMKPLEITKNYNK